jgi:hypothetical protein
MVGTTTSIHSSEESLRIEAICATYRGRSAGNDWGRNNGSVALPEESLLGGIPAVGVCPGRH